MFRTILGDRVNVRNEEQKINKLHNGKRDFKVVKLIMFTSTYEKTYSYYT